MSAPVEQTEETSQAAPEATDDEQPEPFDADRAQAKIKKQNQEAASLRARLKELEPLAAKAKELEEAGRSDLEKLTGRAEQAETRATTAESRAMRLEVAFEKGLTPAQAKRLVGASREELESDADEILRDFPVKTDGRPRGDADIGARTAAPKPAESLDAAIAARIAAGKSR